MRPVLGGDHRGVRAGAADPAAEVHRYSSGTGGECVEVANAVGSAYARDSKNKVGAVLSFDVEQWAMFDVFASR